MLATTKLRSRIADFRYNIGPRAVLAMVMSTCCALALLSLFIYDFKQPDVPAKKSTPSLSAQQPLGWLNASTKPTPALSAEPTDPSKSDATILSRGSEQSSTERGYECRPGFSTIQVPLGSAMYLDGTGFRLTEKRSGPSLYDNQLSVTLHIKLDAATTVPTIIINSAAHNMDPTRYPQYKRQIELKPGMVASYTFPTEGYAGNYLNTGITDITLCTKS